MPTDARFVVDQMTDTHTLGLRAYFRTRCTAQDFADRLRRQGFAVDLYALAVQP